VAGIQPVDPGYARFRVLPQLGDLTRVSATVPARPGTIRVDISVTSGSLELSVQVPPHPLSAVGSSATLANTAVTVNGNPVLRAGAFSSRDGLSFVGSEEGYLKFAVIPGSWAFVLRATADQGAVAQR
jgi:hypothetical protein